METTSLYIRPENQRVLWDAITTSPWMQNIPQDEAAQWFKGIIEEFYVQMSQDKEPMTAESLLAMNQDTIVHMLKQLKQRGPAGSQTNSWGKQVEAFDFETQQPSSTQNQSQTPRWVTYGTQKWNELKSKTANIHHPNPNPNPTTHFPVTNDPYLRTHPLSEVVVSPQHNYGFGTGMGVGVGLGLGLGTSSSNYTEYQPEDSYRQNGNGASEDTFLSRQYGELIEKPKIIHPSVIPKEFSQGNLNPLHTPVVIKNINIDTRFRENLYTSSSTNFTVNLPSVVKNVVSMQLSAYEIPNTFYSISTSYQNHYLWLQCTYQYPNGHITTATRIIVVPDGNYSVSDLIDYINGVLRPMNNDGSLADTNTTTSKTSIFNCIQLVFDLSATGSGTGKVTVAAQDAPGFLYGSAITEIQMNFTLDVDGNPDNVSITSKLGWNLGFIQPTYTKKTTYVSDALPETSSMRYIYLAVNDYQKSVNSNFLGAFNNWILDNNILARIPINGSQFNVLFENQLTQYSEARRYYGPVNLQKMQIQLLDDHGRILNLNQVNYSFCLTLKTLNE